MKKIVCLECMSVFDNNRKLSKHIRDKHYSIKIYYDKFNPTPKCLFCNKEPIFRSLTLGYKKTCKDHIHDLRSDSAYNNRKKLKQNKTKFNKFIQKMSEAKTKFWKNINEKEKELIIKKSSTKNKQNISNLTTQQKKEKFSRYYKCIKDKIIELNSIGAKQCIINNVSYKNNMKGKFKPKNPNKYKGNSMNIFYRSSLEFKAMVSLDSNPNIIEWNSEEIIIPYKSPIDNRFHRYFMDLWIKTKDKEYIIEIKPEHQTKQPNLPNNKKKMRTYLKECATYAVNISKWEMAEKWAKNNNMTFIIVNEKQLGFFNSL